MDLWGDLETFSHADLREVGPYVYAEDESTEILLFAYAIDDGPAQVWDMAKGEPIPEDLREALIAVTADPENTRIIFHNAGFDRTVLRHVLPDRTPPLEAWRDSMVLCYMAGIVGNLEQACRILRTGHEKDPRGDKLKDKFTKLQPKNRKLRRRTPETDPEDWEAFREYARSDINAMRDLWHALPGWNLTDEELRRWHLDQRINDRGLPIDPDAARAATELCGHAKEELNAELTQLTDSEVGSGEQVQALRAWFDREGCPMPDMQAKTIQKALRQVPEGKCRRALEIRQQISKTSTAKYRNLLKGASSDNRLRGVFQFYGAFRTGRWAGRRFQPQNLPRPSVSDTSAAMDAILNGSVDLLFDDTPPMDVASSCIRSVITPQTEEPIIAGDLSNIEGRVLAWLAGEEWKLRAFREYDQGRGSDMYRLTYATAYGRDVSTVTDEERHAGKIMELANGFQGALGAVRSMGVEEEDMSDETVIANVRAWRSAHPRTTRLWWDTEDAAKQAIRHPGKTFKAGRVLWSVRTWDGHPWLLAALPSRRRFLCYFKPEIQGDQVSFEDKDSYTGKWRRMTTYGGRLVENITQGTARDVLACGMESAEARGLYVIGHVHDEIIVEPSGRDPGAICADVEAALTGPFDWTEGLPLAAKAHAMKRYGKS